MRIEQLAFLCAIVDQKFNFKGKRGSYNYFYSLLRSAQDALL